MAKMGVGIQQDPGPGLDFFTCLNPPCEQATLGFSSSRERESSERESQCVCVCVCEREREREREMWGDAGADWD